MPDLTCDSRHLAGGVNAFWSDPVARHYAVKLDADGTLRFRRGGADWVPFDPQPPGAVTHVGADGNRVVARTADGGLHWTCLATDIGSWVDFTFSVVQALARDSHRFHALLDLAQQEFSAQLDLARMLGELFAVGDLWPDGRVPAVPADRRALMDRWLGAYRRWLTDTHTVPAGALHGPWSTLRRPVEAAAGPVDWGQVLDVAVGNWHHTVVTYFALLADGRLLYLDEEPMMPQWRVVPGTATPAERAASGLDADPDAVLTASHSVVAVLQPGRRRVAWRRFDYHNPSDFKLWPLLDWTEPGWTTRAVPLDHPDAVRLDASYHGPGGLLRPWPVPEPHPFLRVMTRAAERELLSTLRLYQDLPPVLDWVPLMGLISLMLGLMMRAAALAGGEEGGGLPPGLDPWGIPELLGRHVKGSATVKALADGFPQLEAEIFALLDQDALFGATPALRDRARALRAADTGFLITARAVIAEASARIDALRGRRSSVGAFGDNTVRPVDAWPLDLWVRGRDGALAHVCAAQARHAGPLARRADVRAPEDPPETGRLRWTWVGPARRDADGQVVRALRVDVEDGLGPDRVYTWVDDQEHGRGAGLVTRLPSAGLTVRVLAGRPPVVRVEGRDPDGGRMHASATIPLPRPSLGLALDLAGSRPLGPPRERHFESADGGLVSAMKLAQQAYGTLRVRLAAQGFADGPWEVSWQATHGHAGADRPAALPAFLDVTTLPAPRRAPGILVPDRLPDPGGVLLAPAPLPVGGTVTLAEPVPFTLTVTVRDGLGQQAQASVSLSPWFPARSEAEGGALGPAPAGADPLGLDERLARLRDELRSRMPPEGARPGAWDALLAALDGVRLARAGDRVVLDGLAPLAATGAVEGLRADAAPSRAELPAAARLEGAGWVERVVAPRPR